MMMCDIPNDFITEMVSAAIAIFAGRTDNMFFCNANIYRSTGTIDQRRADKKYVESMGVERGSRMVTDTSNYEMEST